MLSRLTLPASLPTLFALAAGATMLLAAGAVWQLTDDVGRMLRALLPTWLGIAAVFWVLWRRVAAVPAGGSSGEDRRPPPQLVADLAALQLDRRYADLSALALNDLDYVVLATATTGLRPDRDGVVQLAAVRVRDGAIADGEIFERLVNPGRPIPAAATRFHGITDADVADAPPLAEVMADFAAFAGDAVLVGHNVAFDLGFLNRARVLDNPALDTMLLSIGAFPDRRGHRLDDLAAAFGEEVRGRHTAPGDADLTARLFLRMRDDLARVGVRNFGDARIMCADAARLIGP